MLGSTPIRTIELLSISRTPPFRQFRAGIGYATYRLNTIVVGLELIAEGGQKPEALNVKWQSPATPAKARQTANQAKSFAMVSALVYGSDLFDTYLRDVANVAWLRLSPERVFVAARQGTAPGAHDYSMMERALSLMEELKMEGGNLPAMLDLLSKWRNNLVHAGSAKARNLDPKARDQIIECAKELHDSYANIDICRTLHSFDQRRAPSRKDVTALLAASHNLASAIDQSAIRAAVTDSSALETLADRLLHDRWKTTDDDNAGWQEFCTIWGKTPPKRERELVKVLGQMAITESDNPVSPALGPNYVSDLAALDRARVEVRLKLHD